jgi:hypothetical protein
MHFCFYFFSLYLFKKFSDFPLGGVVKNVYVGLIFHAISYKNKSARETSIAKAAV